MEQRGPQRGWTIAVGVAAAAIVVAGGATFALASTSLNDSPGERLGVTGVRVDVGTDSSSIPGDPSRTPTPTPSPSSTGVETVPGPTPVPADDHGGDNGGRGKGGKGSGDDGSGGHGGDD